MKKLRIVSFGLAVLLIMLLAQVAGAGSSANYAINWQVLSGGGAPASAGTITLNGSLGQTAVGLASNSTLGVSSGYWSGIDNQVAPAPGFGPIYLPLITKNPQPAIGPVD